jgi:hypothetical protein
MELRKTTQASVVQMENIPPEANPYHHDLSNMGETRGTDLHMMYGNHASEDCKYLIFVEKSTGKRFKLMVKDVFEGLDNLIPAGRAIRDDHDTWHWSGPY